MMAAKSTPPFRRDDGSKRSFPETDTHSELGWGGTGSGWFGMMSQSTI